MSKVSGDTLRECITGERTVVGSVTPCYLGTSMHPDVLILPWCADAMSVRATDQDVAQNCDFHEHLQEFWRAARPSSVSLQRLSSSRSDSRTMTHRRISVSAAPSSCRTLQGLR